MLFSFMSLWAPKKSISSPKVFLLSEMARVLMVKSLPVEVELQGAVLDDGQGRGGLVVFEPGRCHIHLEPVAVRGSSPSRIPCARGS